jgi:hypothetical protein
MQTFYWHEPLPPHSLILTGPFILSLTLYKLSTSHHHHFSNEDEDSMHLCNDGIYLPTNLHSVRS